MMQRIDWSGLVAKAKKGLGIGLRDELAAADVRCSFLETVIESQKETITSLGLIIDDNQKKVDDQCLQLAVKDAEIARLKTYVQLHEKEVERCNSLIVDREKLQEQLDAANELLAAANAEIGKLKTQVEQLTPKPRRRK